MIDIALQTISEPLMIEYSKKRTMYPLYGWYRLGAFQAVVGADVGTMAVGLEKSIPGIGPRMCK